MEFMCEYWRKFFYSCVWMVREKNLILYVYICMFVFRYNGWLCLKFKIIMYIVVCFF